MKGLSFRSPPALAIAEGATSPTADLGTTVWSTTLNKLVTFTNLGTWVSNTAAGGSPAGTTGEIQYNNAGAFAGAVNTEIDAAGNLRLMAASAEPAVPTGGVTVYAKELLPGHSVMKTLRPSGVDSPMQDDIAFNNITKQQGGGTVMVAMNAAVLTASAVGTAVVIASGSAKASISRTQYATAATAGALHTLIGIAAGNHAVLRGNVNGEGGFRKVFRFGLNAMVAGNRGFWGIAASTTAATNVDPLTVAAPARIGMGMNLNTGNWFVCGSDGTTAWSTDLGANFPLDTTSLTELVLFCRPHNGTTAGDISYRVRRYTTNFNAPAFEVTGTRSTNLPAATTLLYPWIFLTNNATATACSWQLGHIARQSDS